MLSVGIVRNATLKTLFGSSRATWMCRAPEYLLLLLYIIHFKYTHYGFGNISKFFKVLEIFIDNLNMFVSNK